jgi:hypothetical protein
MTKWGKTHRSLAYQLIAKLMAQPLVQNNNVNVAVVDDNAARRKLEDAFMRLIDARKYESVDPAVYVNNERVIDHKPQAAVPRPQPSDPAHQAAADDAASPQKGPFSDRGGVSTIPRETSPGGGQKKLAHYSNVPGLSAGAAVGEGADDKLSTTQRFYLYHNRGGRMP